MCNFWILLVSTLLVVQAIDARYLQAYPKCRVWKVSNKVYKNCFFGTAATRTSTSTSTKTSTKTSTSTVTSTSTSTKSYTYTSAITNYWKFNANNVDQVTSVSLTPSSAMTYVADHSGNANSAVYLNSQYFTLASGVYFNGAFSVTAWVKQLTYGVNNPRLVDCGTATSAVDNVVLNLQGSGNGGFNVYVFSNSVQSNFVSTVNSPLSVWIHYGVVQSGSTNVGTIYVNGAAGGTGTLYQPRAVTRTNCYFGFSNWGSVDPYPNAYFDSIMFFNRTLTQAEVQSVMNTMA